MKLKKKKKPIQFPSVRQIEIAISKEKYMQKYKKVLKSTFSSLIVVAAIAVLIATLAMPVLQIQGSSMEPTLKNEEIVALLKTPKLERGQLCCFSYQNKHLIKRIIGLPGDIIDIDKDGFVYVNGELIEEPYVIDRTLGECDVNFPLNVKDNHYFILGDNRATSIDSRSSVVGLVSKEQIIGKIFFRIWPFNSIGLIKH